MATNEVTTTPIPGLDQLRAIVRAQLADLERTAASLSVEQLAAGLTASQFDVYHILAARPEADQYVVSMSWTEKGLRHAWAKQMFWERVYWVDDEPANVTPIKPAELDVDEQPAAVDPQDDRLAPAYTLLRELPNGRRDFSTADLIYAVRAIGRAMEMANGEQDFFDAMAGALKVVGSALEDAIGNVDYRHQEAARRAIRALERS